jgi:mannose-1-phosphate guanylyltransferase
LRQDPDAVVAVLPSDHFIRDEPEFLRVVEKALGVARDGYLCTIGIVPTRPDTGYGYIEVGEVLSPGSFMVSRFVEKPERARADEFVRGGKHLWNAGMFFFEARTMARAIETHLPDLFRGLEEIDAAARRGEEESTLAAVFPTLPSISIDHGVMEKASAVAVVPGDFGWNDVGSWESAWELSTKDEARNGLPQDAVAIDASGNFVCDRTTTSGKRVYALVGVSDLILVETDDAVLLIPRDRAQDVRAVVERLKLRGDAGRL